MLLIPLVEFARIVGLKENAADAGDSFHSDTSIQSSARENTRSP
jgi:hypothetical protein